MLNAFNRKKLREGRRSVTFALYIHSCVHLSHFLVGHLTDDGCMLGY